MSDFVSGLERLLSNEKNPPISTDSPGLDNLLRGIRGDVFYFFYGDSELSEELFTHILVNALKPGTSEKPSAIYMLCGNYRVERTIIGTETLIQLLQSSGMSTEDALSRVHILCAFSADQQAMVVEEIEKLIERDPNVRIILVKGLFNLERDDARTTGREKVRGEIQRSMIRLRQLCAGRNIPLVASGRSTIARRERLPQLEGSSFLKHLANVIVYLRPVGKSSKYARAFVVKNPMRRPRSIEYGYEVNDGLGRSTPPVRVSFQDTVSRLRKDFRDALVQKERREAFDQMVEAWSSELGAMTFSESLTLLDLMHLVAAVENRRLYSDLNERVSKLESRLGEDEP